jgi:pyruvate formate lyase activating enzyme
MSEITIYSATGCTRCKIVKEYMKERGIAYTEKDMKADGKEDFQKFYTANRKRIFRGPEGIEFPIVTDGTVIRQGLGASLAYLQAGSQLDGFFSVGTLHKEWVDGIHIAGGNVEDGDKFLAVLRHLKRSNFKLVVDTYGRNPELLEQILAEKMADVVIMEVIASPELASRTFGQTVAKEDVAKSIALVTKAPEYRFQTTVHPIVEDGQARYLTPQEVAMAAQLLETVTQSKKNPYLIRLFRPERPQDDRIGDLACLQAGDLLSYRTQARKYQVMAEVEKD